MVLLPTNTHKAETISKMKAYDVYLLSFFLRFIYFMHEYSICMYVCTTEEGH